MAGLTRIGFASGLLGVVIGCGVVGCGDPAPSATSPAKASKRLPAAAAIQKAKPAEIAVVAPPTEPVADVRSAPLAADDIPDKPAVDRAYTIPTFDEQRLAAAGIRKIAGRHLILYTDLPAGDVDELPAVFDAAVPLWCEYFGVEPAKTAAWQAVAHIMRDKERFVGAGLYPETLPSFPNGFSSGSQLWIYDQPSAYYRRHLLVHEGTHLFMYRWLGGAGPPWYMEGLAELLGTHRWEAGKLTLGVMPRSKDEVPYWGRVKIVRDELAAGRGMTLLEIMNYGDRAHLKNEPYGWCWAAAAFLDGHPATQAAFRDLKNHAQLERDAFARQFREGLTEPWSAISEDWQLFVIDCDYGYDFARAAIKRKPAVPLPDEGATVALASDQGWQSTGYRLEAATPYEISASGRFELGGAAQPWPCEAGGVTLRYHGGRPRGMLVGVVYDEQTPTKLSPLAAPESIGLSTVLKPAASGTLYLRVNEQSAELAGNRGALTVQIRAAGDR